MELEKKWMKDDPDGEWINSNMRKKGMITNEEVREVREMREVREARGQDGDRKTRQWRKKK